MDEDTFLNDKMCTLSCFPVNHINLCWQVWEFLKQVAKVKEGPAPSCRAHHSQIGTYNVDLWVQSSHWKKKKYARLFKSCLREFPGSPVERSYRFFLCGSSGAPVNLMESYKWFRTDLIKSSVQVSCLLSGMTFSIWQQNT